MRRRMLSLVSVVILAAAINSLTYAQGSSTSSLTGSAADPTGAVIAGAQVIVKNNATSAEFRAVTAANGTFSIPSLDAGTYTVSISAPGFKQVIINDVKLDAGAPSTVRVSLDVGSTSESVVVQGGAEILQTQSANISTTMSINQIANLPLVSRNPINFVTFLPGVNTAGLNRDSQVNGLPEGAISISLDGINIQDNFNKTTDGLFARVSPRVDSVEEVTISTATPGAESGAQGSVQIKFITRRGTNDLHGSIYEYHRNPWLNSNYWFNNRDQASIHEDTGLTCSTPQQAFDREKCKAPRDRVLLNQFGGRVGGPIVIPKLFNGRDRAFFFVNFETSRQPSAATRNRTVLNTRTQQGIFRYNRTVNNQPTVQEVNLLELAARNGHTATIDPVIGKLLADIRNSTTKTGAVFPLADPNQERFTFTNTGLNIAYIPTVRLDFNLTSRHNLELSWTYQTQRGGPDFLNNVDPAFPGFPNSGAQPADRYTGAVAVRSTLSPTLVNEARAGLSGGPSRFNPEANAGTFSGSVANQGGFALNMNGATGTASGITNAHVVTAPSRRNPLLRGFSDTLTWTRGAHSLSFGGEYTQLNLTLSNVTLVPTIGFGVNTNDPADSMFTAANFPGAANADLTRARGIYAVLTGRVTSIAANARLDEKTGKYVYLGKGVQRGRQRELGFFVQDAWRMRPSLTLNYGLRWELQGSFVPLNNSYSTIPVEGLWGISGPGNLFKPGVMTGRTPQFIQFKEGEKSYNLDYKNFAPSFGFAWSPNPKRDWLRRLTGDGGQTVVRGGYSMSYNRNGLGDFSGTFGANPGVAITTNRDLTIGNLVGGSLGSLPVLLRETSRLGPPAFSPTPVYPFTEVVTGDANIFDPNIKVPYAQSWSFGIQRELTKDMAIEVRYVGTRHLRGWTDYDLNDVEGNIFENGFLNEFKLAQRNLEIFKAANPNCSTAGNPACSFAFRGLPGQSPLPIILGYFQGLRGADINNSARYTSTNFTSATFVNDLSRFDPDPEGFAGNLHADAGRRTNALNAGFPANFFLTNPDLRGGVFFTGNGGYTRYDGLQMELRRRLSRGLLVQANYTFAKSFSSSRFSFRTPRVNTQPTGVLSTLQHAFKANWVYELPIGQGKTLFGGVGSGLNRFLGGWEFHGTARVQTGQNLNFGSVRLVGMTREEFADSFGLYFDDSAKIIYHLPKDIVENTIKAHNTSATSPTGYGERGVPTGRYLAPASTLSCIQVVTGDCAPQTLYVTGPGFARFDMSVVKRVKISERLNFELRGEFLNAFNNINYFGSTNLTNFNNDLFGQVTSAYRDISNTQDPGGRLIQIVARFNF